MAQEGSEASVASTSTNPNWWDIHANPISSWNYSWQEQHQQQQQQEANPNSSTCDEDISISGASFTNASNQSGLSVGSSSATDLSTEQVAVADNHLWRQVLLSTGSGGAELHKNHGDGENFLEVLSSKNLATDMFGPAACDYLKKLDESWEFTAPAPFTGLDKQLGGCNTKPINQERPAPNLSDLVSNWSIAPPQPQFDQHSATAAGLMEPNNFSHIKHEVAHSSPYSSPAYGISTGSIGFLPANYGQEMKDLINFGGSSSNCRIPKPCSIKQSDSAESKKPGHDVSSAARGHGKVGIGNASEGKKKRSDQDNSEALMKKSKQETSSSSCAKFQAPKVKLGEKITALQQIVSPFGKTDTASVLLEAIKYIEFLHQQVQIYSDPFMKSGVNKELNPWGGGMDKKEKQEMKQDLSSRGLCLFPVSCTPQFYRENTGPDYWTPTYRGSLYRS